MLEDMKIKRKDDKIIITGKIWIETYDAYSEKYFRQEVEIEIPKSQLEPYIYGNIPDC